ncbi:MAG: HAD hydrolase-like protein [Lachnospiraceae bacterium]|nr:HAD hydrolase-like protein [Lachnospiraceae bacterium]
MYKTNNLTKKYRLYAACRYFSYYRTVKSPRIFELALERASCSPENAVMIGDRLDNDIIPAKRFIGTQQAARETKEVSSPAG